MGFVLFVLFSSLCYYVTFVYPKGKKSSKVVKLYGLILVGEFLCVVAFMQILKWLDAIQWLFEVISYEFFMGILTCFLSIFFFNFFYHLFVLGIMNNLLGFHERNNMENIHRRPLSLVRYNKETILEAIRGIYFVFAIFINYVLLIGRFYT